MRRASVEASRAIDSASDGVFARVARRLEGKVALVTGAGSGQGREVALLFARAGAKVHASDINGSGIRETAALAAADGLELSDAVVDASSVDAVGRWVSDAAARDGGIDILYNNGAAAQFARFAEMGLDQWRQTLKMELDVVFVPSQAVWPHLISRGGGSIINVASVCGMRGVRIIAAAAHAAGKSGVIGLTRQQAVEGAPHRIRVNSISPGPILTPATQNEYNNNPTFREQFDRCSLLPRTGTGIDVAYVGLFLASDEAGFVTGVNLPVDGGLSAFAGPG